MTVTFETTARQKAQLIWACEAAGIAHAPGERPGTLTCDFDDPAILLAWHSAFVMDML